MADRMSILVFSIVALVAVVSLLFILAPKPSVTGESITGGYVFWTNYRQAEGSIYRNYNKNEAERFGNKTVRYAFPEYIEEISKASEEKEKTIGNYGNPIVE